LRPTLTRSTSGRSKWTLERTRWDTRTTASRWPSAALHTRLPAAAHTSLSTMPALKNMKYAVRPCGAPRTWGIQPLRTMDDCARSWYQMQRARRTDGHSARTANGRCAPRRRDATAMRRTSRVILIHSAEATHGVAHVGVSAGISAPKTLTATRAHPTCGRCAASGVGTGRCAAAIHQTVCFRLQTSRDSLATSARSHARTETMHKHTQRHGAVCLTPPGSRQSFSYSARFECCNGVLFSGRAMASASCSDRMRAHARRGDGR
jgi:hypothetical protein